MRNLSRTLVVAVALLSSSLAQGAVSPIGLSLLAPVQLPPTSFSIAGVRASALWGHHRDVYGFDFGGIGNITDISFGGTAVAGVFNLNKGVSTVVGIQAAGLGNINVNKATIIGLQVSGFLNSNQAESSLIGFQVAPINYSPYTKVGGLQAGLYNRSRAVYGFQIGLVNMTDSLHGIQVGLINFNKTGLFAVAPILNIGF